MSRSKNTKAAAAEKIEVINAKELQAMPTQEIPEELSAEATEVSEEQTSAVDQAARELEELKEKMAEAKRKLAEAKKANTKSRPVRLSRFVVRAVNDEVSTEVSKSDVHYCAEKTAIDLLNGSLKEGTPSKTKYEIWKQPKAENADSGLLVETLWIDTETNQIVIE